MFHHLLLVLIFCFSGHLSVEAASFLCVLSSAFILFWTNTHELIGWLYFEVVMVRYNIIIDILVQYQYTELYHIDFSRHVVLGLDENERNSKCKKSFAYLQGIEDAKNGKWKEKSQCHVWFQICNSITKSSLNSQKCLYALFGHFDIFTYLER